VNSEQSKAPGDAPGESQSDARVAAVLLNWNGCDFTIDCVRTLLEQSYSALRIIIIDNGSADDSVQRLQGIFGEAVTVQALGENRGFCGGCNAGISLALKDGADYVLLLNNDTEAAHDMVSELVAVAQQQPQAGAVGGKIYNFEPRDTLWFAGGDIKRGYLRFVTRGLNQHDNGAYDQVAESPFISGCCLLLPRAAIERVGQLDERFFAYYEDAEYCLRLARAGLRCWYAPRAVLWHHEGASSGRTVRRGPAPMVLHLGTRNRLWLVRLYGSPLEKLVTLSGATLRGLLRATALAVRGQGEAARALWRGLREGLTARL
jgi:GT2 family glycosyltransferase